MQWCSPPDCSGAGSRAQVEALQKEQEQQAEVVATNRGTTPAAIYARDLDAFMEALEDYEAREAKNLASLAEKQRRAGNNRVKAAARKVRPGWFSMAVHLSRDLWRAACPPTQAKGAKKKRDDSDSDTGASDDDFQPAKARFHFILLRESSVGLIYQGVAGQGAREEGAHRQDRRHQHSGPAPGQVAPLACCSCRTKLRVHQRAST